KGKDFRVYSEKSEVYTMTGRKKTDDEKHLIVKDYLDGDLAYAEIAKKYNVSYNNIYSWVQKYKTHGPDGLVDRRGRRKLDSIQTDEEKLKTEIAALKARNEYLATENAALKKLKEVERELMLNKQDTKMNTKQSKKPLSNLSDLIQHAYHAHKGIYGYRRMTIFLNHFLNAKVNHKCVYRLMQLLELKAVIRRKRYKYKPHSPQHVAENVLDRAF